MTTNIKGISFKTIILEHLRKIAQISCNDFNTLQLNTSNAKITDPKNVYCNAVEYLYDTLYPHFDAQMSKDGNEFEAVLRDKKKELDKNISDARNNETAIKILNINWGFEKQFNYRICFRKLCCFLKRKNYLELGSYTAES